MRVVVEALVAGVLALAVAVFSWFDVGVDAGASERTVRRLETSSTERVQAAEAAATPTTVEATSSTC